jgi:hypothetical protein
MRAIRRGTYFALQVGRDTAADDRLPLEYSGLVLLPPAGSPLHLEPIELTS